MALVGSIYMAGLFAGSFPFGALSDKIGRLKASMVAILTTAVFQLAGAFMPEYISYTATRFLAAMGKHFDTFGLYITLTSAFRFTWLVHSPLWFGS